MTLNDRHLADLESSGLDRETIRAAGVFSATAEEAKRFLGFSAGPGLAFPYPGTNGDGAPFVRIKPDTPFAGSDGKPAKYLTAKGAGNRLYIPPRYSDKELQDVQIPVIITEGEKKALKGAEELGGFVVVGLSGVWCFKNKEHDLIPDFERLRWKDRQAAVAYDSDLVDKPQIQQAESALAHELGKRRVYVRLCRIPALGDGKTGLDDYLLSRPPEAFVAEVLDRALIWSASGPFAVETAGELAAREIVWDDGVVGSGILPENAIAFITGYAKVGKSLLVLQLAFDVACGRPFLGFSVPRARSVLLIQQEVSESSMADRIRKMLGGGSDPGSRLKIVNLAPVTLDTAQGRRAIEAALALHKPEVLILDPLYKLHSKDENDAKEMKIVTDALESLRRDFGVAIVVVHHHGQPSKDSGRRGFQLMRGSSILGAAGDSYMTLTEKAKGVHTLSFTLRNAEAPDAIELRREPETLRYRPTGRRERSLKVEQWEKIIAILDELGGEAKRQTLIELCSKRHKVSERTVTKALGAALEAGAVTKRQEGRETIYAVAQHAGDDGKGNDGKLPSSRGCLRQGVEKEGFGR